MAICHPLLLIIIVPVERERRRVGIRVERFLKKVVTKCFHTPILKLNLLLGARPEKKGFLFVTLKS